MTDTPRRPQPGTRQEPGCGLDDRRRDAAAVAALGLAPGTVRRLLHGIEPSEAWARLQAGRHPADPLGRLRRLARPELPDRVADACRRTGTTVLLRGDPEYPEMLGRDAEAPEVLFVTGAAPEAVLGADGRALRVAVVGTRSPSGTGARVARAIGAQLAEAGVVVVSGLARGIDAAAHDGALAAGGAPAVGVLGAAADAAVGGDDERRRGAVADAGVLLSEVAPGAASRRWAFAVRNRIMAALSQAVVVVESHERGGSLHTVRAAVRRAVPVLAVPGSVLQPSCAGTNALLAAGTARAVRNAGDILDLLSPRTARRVRRRPPPPAAPDEQARLALAALDAEPSTVDRVALHSGLPLADAAVALERLADAGLACHQGGWWTRAGP